jgi:hypothetical protein
MLELERRKEAEDKLSDLSDKALEKGLKKTMKVLIEGLMSWDDSNLWGKAYKAFYAPHITILSKLIVTELKYDHQWTVIVQLRASVDIYTRQLNDLLGRIDSPKMNGNYPPMEGRAFVDVLDAVVRGGLNVLFSCTERVKKLNKMLEIIRPSNQFDFVIGKHGNYTARNNLCDSIKELMKVVEEFADFRNSWARAVKMDLKETRINRGVLQDQCPKSLF